MCVPRDKKSRASTILAKSVVTKLFIFPIRLSPCFKSPVLPCFESTDCPYPLSLLSSAAFIIRTRNPCSNTSCLINASIRTNAFWAIKLYQWKHIEYNIGPRKSQDIQNQGRIEVSGGGEEEVSLDSKYLLVWIDEWAGLCKRMK